MFFCTYIFQGWDFLFWRKINCIHHKNCKQLKKTTTTKKTYQIQSKFDPDMLTNPDPISILLEVLWIPVCCYAFGRCCNPKLCMLHSRYISYQFMHSLALPIKQHSLLFQVQNFLTFYSISYGSNYSKIYQRKKS